LPNKNYIRGRNTEYKCKAHLTAKGYYTMRTAGSHSNFDIIALSKQNLLLVQLKRTKTIPKTKMGWDKFKKKYKGRCVRLYNTMEEYLPDNAYACIWVWMDARGWLQIYHRKTDSHHYLDTKNRNLMEWDK